MSEQAYLLARRRMVTDQLAGRGIRDPRVLDAMGRVPRHAFVAEELRSMAYEDGPLPIGESQTISQPYVVALMTQLLRLEGHEKVLEVGTGSGYQAAVLAEVAGQVYTVERVSSLARSATVRLRELGYDNVEVIEGDGSRGLPEHSPYHGILVAAAAPLVAQALLNQLEQGGRIVIPVGGRRGQILQVWTRCGDNFSQRQIAPVAFVPLLGDLGWQNRDPESNAWG